MVHGQQAHCYYHQIKYNLFHRTHKLADSLFSLYLNNVSLERKIASTRFLGVVIDECLSWKLHISNVLVKCCIIDVV